MSNEPQAPGPLVELCRAQSPFEARVIAAVLDDAQIQSFIAGELLNDEFAMSQRLMGLQAVKVQVRADRLEDARAALAAAKATGAAMAEDGDVEDPPSPAKPSRGGFFGWALLFLLGSIIFGALWLNTLAELKAQQRSRLTQAEWTGSGLEHRWVHNNQLASKTVDTDRDGVLEKVTSYNRDGREISTMFDANQNGMYERSIQRGRTGQSVIEALDADEDGVWELIKETRADGSVAVWTDEDQDGGVDRIEVSDRRGARLSRLVFEPGRGFVEQP
ncbi:MAG: DUF2007 domain-containing protein [Planctomycetota bacterium]